MSVQITKDLHDVPGDPCIVTIGNFDGMHRGHQALMQEVVTHAREAGVMAAAITFDPHPVRFFRGADYPPFLLSSARQRAAAIAACGIDLLVELRFDGEVAGMEPPVFIRKILVEGLNAQHVLVGYDFAFGRGRQGTINDLVRVGSEAGFTAKSFGPILDDGAPISSSRVRAQLRDGAVREAQHLLGRPFAVDGTVVLGDQRGRDLGFPTANLSVGDQVVPGIGIYATSLTTPDGVEWDAVTSIGVRATFYDEQAPVVVETFVLDAPDGFDIYGAEVEVAFFEHIRGEERFDGIEPLIAQMHADCDVARSVHQNRR